MTREEKANKLGQEYFPDESNIWARANFEAQWVSEACIKMAEWEHKRLVEKACDWLWNEIYERIDDSGIRASLYEDSYRANLVDAFREAMEE